MPFYDRDVDVLFDTATLNARIAELGAAITKDYEGLELTLVGIMKGSVFFLADAGPGHRHAGDAGAHGGELVPWRHRDDRRGAHHP